MLVGQNPGGRENLDGQAFIGPSGVLLDAMLEEAGLGPTDVFRTNAVKCMTPSIDHEQRAPSPAEIAACHVHLVAEIAAVQPRIIVALGDTALQALCKTSGVTGKRGQPFPLHASFGYSADVLVTFHPSFVLRIPTARALVVADLRKARDYSMPQTTQAWSWWDGADFVGDVLAYDIETYRADGSIGEDVTMLSVTDDTGTYVTAERIPDIIASVRAAAANGCKVVSHNGWAFDDPKTGITSTTDTMLWGYLADETQSLALESLCVRYLGVRGWKEERGLNPAYCARDSAYCRRLYLYLYDTLGPRAHRIAASLMTPLRRALDACTARGVYIDGDAVEIERVAQAARIDAARTDVDAIASEALPNGAFDVQLKTKIRRVPFNPGSTLHVGRVYDALGVWLPTTAKKGDARTDEETLQRHAPTEPFTKALLEWRGATKRMSTYIEKYARFATSDDHRTHPAYTIWRVPTGRTSATDNFQNLDRDLKGFFSAPPGGCLGRYDYNAIEFWVAVWYANIERLIDARRDARDFDPHRWFAARLFACDEGLVTKNQRQIAKSAHFGLLYGGWPQTLIDYAIGYGINLSMEQATYIYRIFHHTYPEIRLWWDRVERELRANGYVESPTGRRRNFGDVTLLRGSSWEAAKREAVNALDQGFATGDIAELGLIACHQAGFPVAGFIHDEVLLDWPSEGIARSHEEAVRTALIEEPVRVLRDVWGIEFPAHLLGIEATYVLGKDPA